MYGVIRTGFCNPVHSFVLKEASSHFELVNTEDKTMAETQTVRFLGRVSKPPGGSRFIQCLFLNLFLTPLL